MSTCTDKLREAHANLGNATQALRDAIGSEGVNELLADCILDQIGPVHALKIKVARLYEVAARADQATAPSPIS